MTSRRPDARDAPAPRRVLTYANATRLETAPEETRVVCVSLGGGLVAKCCASTCARYPSVCTFPGDWRPVQGTLVITP